MAATATLFEQTWASLLETMTKVFCLQPISHETYVGHYNAVEKYFVSLEYQESFIKDAQEIMRMTARAAAAASNGTSPDPTQERPRRAGDQTYRRVEQFLRNRVEILARNDKNFEGEDFLRFYADNWNIYQTLSKILNGIFLSMNSNWIRRQQREGQDHIYEIFTLAMHVWKQLFFEQSSQSLTETCFQLIRRERNGERINGLRIKNVVLSYVLIGAKAAEQSGNYQQAHALKIYRELFENKFLEDTDQFYRVEVTTLLSHGVTMDYMRKVKQRLDEEEQRVKNYLHETTALPLSRLVEKILIEEQLALFYEEAKKFILEENVEALQLLYSLVSRLPEKTVPIAKDFESHITRITKEAMDAVVDTALTDAKVYVGKILEMYGRFNEISTKAFCSDVVFQTARNESFVNFANRNAVTLRAGSTKKSAELLAEYCDELLRREDRVAGGHSVEERMEQTMIIFNYIEDKDVFQKFYGKKLAKRLLTQSSSSTYEEFMLKKLTEICGYEYASKLKRMFDDISDSAILQRKYHDYCEQKKLRKICDFAITVLKSNSWSYKVSAPFQLPEELSLDLNRFSEFYATQYSGRKLQILYPQSRCELKTLYTRSQYIFQVSTYQTALLLLFNDAASNTVQEMLDRTQIEAKLLLLTLLSLLKSKVLVCSAISKDRLAGDFKETDIKVDNRIEVNHSYTNTRIKVNLNIAIRSVEQGESAAVIQTVEEDRKLVTQAAIVRIMKARKTLPHNALIQEVIPQLTKRFTPDIPQIKKCIEILIEKEYLERERETSGYKYLA